VILGGWGEERGFWHGLPVVLFNRALLLLLRLLNRGEAWDHGLVLFDQLDAQSPSPAFAT
jgi:hypothetical protein